MWIPIHKNWGLSIVLNKAPYATCMNPHILICERHVRSYGVRFPPYWGIWNIELNRKKRAFQKRMAAKEANSKVRVKRVFQVGRTLSRTFVVSLYIENTDRLAFYYKFPWMEKTGAWTGKSAFLRRLYFFAGAVAKI